MIARLVYSPHVIRNIISFCSEGRTCYFFGISCKNLYKEFRTMMNISSRLLYRVNYVNHDLPPKPVGWETHRCFDIFNPPERLPMKFKLDPILYVQDFEEYVSHLKEESLFVQLIMRVLSDINKEYGEVAMISGSFALLGLLKKKSFFEHSKLVNERFELKIEKKIRIISPMDNTKEDGLFECSEKHLSNVKMGIDLKKLFFEKDIDVFILGDKKKEICERILIELYRRSINLFPEKIKVMSKSGCTDIYVERSSSENVPWRTHHRFRKVLQLIQRTYAKKPMDIFAFFDLGCCCIGYFPGLQKVVAPPRFIKSVTTFMNHSDFQYQAVSSNAKHRITKYFFRTGIRTSIETPHPMCFFHTYNRILRDRDDYLSAYDDFHIWGDFEINAKGEIKMINKSKLLTYKRYPEEMDEEWRMFHFGDGELLIPKGGAKNIILNYYNEEIRKIENYCDLEFEEQMRVSQRIRDKLAKKSTRMTDFQKGENLFSFDLVESLIFHINDDDNRNNIEKGGRKKDKEMDPRLEYIINERKIDIKKVFMIEPRTHEYFYRCFGLAPLRLSDGTKTNRYGYVEKIFPNPRTVKALLCYDRKKEVFFPAFLKRYQCHLCGKINEKMKFTKATLMRKCGGCGKVRYCSRECQKKDWKNHKIKCKKKE